MNILITGSSGFIGHNTVEMLQKSHSLFTPRYYDFPIDDQDEMNAYFALNHINAVIHCATKPAHRNVSDMSQILYENMRLFSALYEASIRNQVERFIITGSGSEYDMRHYMPKMSESSLGLHIPKDENGLTKYLETKIIQHDSRFVNLRFFGIFGKYEDYSIRFISNMICKAIFSMPLTIKQDKRFDYIYINDGVRIIDHFLHHQNQHPDYNVTTGETMWLSQIAEYVREISGKNLTIDIADPSPGVEYSGDNSRLLSEIGHFNFTPMREAIKDLYAWYMAHIDRIDISKLKFDK